MKQFLPRPLQILKNNSGVALLIAITTIALVAFIAVELSYDSASEYIIANQEINRLKSRYAAKAGIEISLLRINIYRQAQKQFGQLLGNKKAVLDQIWSMPFIWPPILPEEASGVDKGELQDTLAESYMDATFTSNISSEGSKIDLVDLVSPSKILRNSTKATLIRLIGNRIQQDDDFARRNRDLPVEAIVNNIIDWMDTDSVSLNSGDEGSLYGDITDSKLPPNQPFKTMEELHMVAGMTDELYEFLAPQVTIFGIKAIQVNHASKEVLMGIHSVINEEIADKIIERRSGEGGPFSDQNNFLSFLSTLGVNTEQIKDNLPPLVFDVESNFRIQSIGTFGRTSSEIVAIVYDFDKVKEKLTESLENDKKQQQGEQGGQSGTNPGPQDQRQQQKQEKPPEKRNGRPNIVYWTES